MAVMVLRPTGKGSRITSPRVPGEIHRPSVLPSYLILTILDTGIQTRASLPRPEPTHQRIPAPSHRYSSRGRPTQPIVASDSPEALLRPSPAAPNSIASDKGFDFALPTVPPRIAGVP